MFSIEIFKEVSNWHITHIRPPVVNRQISPWPQKVAH